MRVYRKPEFTKRPPLSAVTASKYVSPFGYYEPPPPA